MTKLKNVQVDEAQIAKDKKKEQQEREKKAFFVMLPIAFIVGLLLGNAMFIGPAVLVGIIYVKLFIWATDGSECIEEDEVEMAQQEPDFVPPSMIHYSESTYCNDVASSDVIDSTCVDISEDTFNDNVLSSDTDGLSPLSANQTFNF